MDQGCRAEATNEIPAYARRVADLVGARVVAFGHTHRPRVVPLSPGRSFVDTGTWALMPSKDDPQKVAPGTRNYLLVSFSEQGTTLKLDSWGVLEVARPVALRIAS